MSRKCDIDFLDASMALRTDHWWLLTHETLHQRLVLYHIKDLGVFRLGEYLHTCPFGTIFCAFCVVASVLSANSTLPDRFLDKLGQTNHFHRILINPDTQQNV